LIKWDPHYLANPWSDNVVALGLSNGLIDPLEANVLYTTVYGIQTLARCLIRGYGARAYNKAMSKIHYENSNFILHHYKLSNRTDTPFWEYYSKFDVRETLWKNYRKTDNKYTNLFPDAIWATLGVYFDEFTYYE
jgi:tryptophan halogenase